MGIIIERLSQLSYQEYIEGRILAPLKMSDSATRPAKIAAELLSKAYAGAEEMEDPMLRDAPAGTGLHQGDPPQETLSEGILGLHTLAWSGI